ncbi:TAXI family TRAP transporter solute-binding subunit [Treponema parvum]|uniref:TAXI family TRAP transporter solute-binding subunit n=1 Tax=Treponema parvum TaxID=138851 RepID=A0A975EYM9_9SPIR|nr:TAXI family TRAP transporter solute-binding subunit [Treponema parvum]QTQ10794.1 TAXI family TRAP transporter solute-binding subunit [Treponema parvum]
MKNVSIRIIFAAVLAAVILGGCSGKKASTGAHEKVTIKFPTASASGALYAVGAAITNVWDTKIDFVSASSQASNGGIDNLNQIADGESQVSIAISSNCYQSYNGTDSFEGAANKNLRIIAGLYFNPNQVVVTKKSGITSLSGVKGKRFAVAAAGSSVEGECKNHFTATGLNYPSDIQAEYIAFGDAADMLQNGTLDGAWIMSGIPAAAVSQACSSGCTLVSIGDDILEKLRVSYPWYARYTIPAGTYPGQNADIETTAIKMTMFCNSTLDDETVYMLTKTFWENVEELGNAQRNLKGLKPENAVKDIAGLPLHEGAKRYYTEIGVSID